MKKAISFFLFFIFLFENNIYGCCGCANVDAAMSSLKSTTNEWIRNIDKQATDNFDNKVFQRSKNSVGYNKKARNNEIKYIKLNKEIFKDLYEIIFLLEKQEHIKYFKKENK